jgi:hypothetical protein
MHPISEPVAGASNESLKFPSRDLIMTVSPDNAARLTRGNSRSNSVTVVSIHKYMSDILSDVNAFVSLVNQFLQGLV